LPPIVNFINHSIVADPYAISALESHYLLTAMRAGVICEGVHM
jgi:hypothetical protein